MLQDTLMNLAKAVANAAAMLVLKAKNVAQVAEDTILQNRVIAAATQCALSTSQLVACTKVLFETSPVTQQTKENDAKSIICPLSSVYRVFLLLCIILPLHCQK